MASGDGIVSQRSIVYYEDKRGAYSAEGRLSGRISKPTLVAYIALKQCTGALAVKNRKGLEGKGEFSEATRRKRSQSGVSLL